MVEIKKEVVVELVDVLGWTISVLDGLKCLLAENGVYRSHANIDLKKEELKEVRKKLQHAITEQRPKKERFYDRRNNG